MSRGMKSAFVEWAFDHARTLEERFGAECLVEAMLPDLYKKEDWSWRANYDAQLYRHKARKLDPAYEPEFTREAAEKAQAALAERKALSFSGNDDRHLRDLSFLQFCPALEELTLYNAELANVSPLIHVPNLRKLYLFTDVNDLSPIAALQKLETLWITLGCPWPDVRGLDGLPLLTSLHFSGNLLLLRDIQSLPAVRELKLSHRGSFTIPLRDLHDLPAMPELRRMSLDNTWRLAGFDRFPKLLNLIVYGYFDDLEPLAALKQLTHLTITGGSYESLRPLAMMPELRSLTVRREVPQEYTPLAEAPMLRELQVELCPISKLEVATLNLVLDSWALDFGVHPPRPLHPLRLLTRDGCRPPPEYKIEGLEPRDFGENEQMRKSEKHWFSDEVLGRLDALLGKGWRITKRTALSLEHGNLTIARLEDIERLPQIVEQMRQALCRCRHSFQILLIVDSLERFERDLDDIEDEDKEDEFDAEREREDWEDTKQRERERQEFLERAYQFKLRKAGGMEVKPGEFAPSLPAPEDAREEQEESPYDPAARLHLYVRVWEDAAVVSEDDADLAEYLLGIKAEICPKSEGQTEEEDEMEDFD